MPITNTKAIKGNNFDMLPSIPLKLYSSLAKELKPLSNVSQKCSE